MPRQVYSRSCKKLLLNGMLLEYNMLPLLLRPHSISVLCQKWLGDHTICPDSMFLPLSSFSFKSVLNLICSKSNWSCLELQRSGHSSLESSVPLDYFLRFIMQSDSTAKCFHHRLGNVPIVHEAGCCVPVVSYAFFIPLAFSFSLFANSI